MTAVEQAIEKIDKQIEIAQVNRLRAFRIQDTTSMERHHGMKIALVFIRQELVNLLEVEKKEKQKAFKKGKESVNLVC